jgi:hypothetical protein
VQQCLLQRRHRDLLASWDRQRRALLADAERLLSDATAAEAAAAASAARRLEWEAASQRGRGCLVAWRCDRDVATQASAQRAAAAAAAGAAAAVRRRQAEAAAWAVDKAAIAQHRARQAGEAAQARAAAESEAAARARHEAARLQADRPAVEARQAAALKGLVERMEARQRAEKAALARARRLDKATYHPEAPADPGRVLLPTAASAAVAQAPEWAAFQPMNGYSTRQVVQDPRFRLLEALGHAGLRGTRAAAEAVVAAAAVPGSRRGAGAASARGLVEPLPSLR